ncbi:HpcH/HpaI aldolase/citrate lyase family protein [Paenarthrobacter sp. NPDC058040]|uniref:HpcH/HpaI aldolase family protein n=1 Tax=unclassified Paenarthrobacter TaxID=2634190 RepID=UPI0036D9F631
MSNARLRTKLQNDETTYGMWVTLESTAVIEIAVALDLDWVCIDLEHGYLSYEQVGNLLTAAQRTELSVLVRVPSHDLEPTKRVLDLGADGVVIPLVGNADVVKKIRDYSYYPPKGSRGLGGERNVGWGLKLEEYISRANDDIMVIPVIETQEGIENFDKIISIEGTEAIVIGPGDLSSSYGYLGQWEGPGMKEVILEAMEKAQTRGIATAVLGRNIEDVKLRRDQGFKMVGLGSDAGMIVRHLADLNDALERKTVVHRWF